VKKIIRKKQFLRILISFLLFLSFIFTGALSEGHADVSGPWTGTLTVSVLGEQETGTFIDVWYQEDDVLFIPGTIICPLTLDYVTLYQVSGNTFSLSSPISCSPYNSDVTIDSFSLTFFNNSFTGNFTGSAFNYPYNGNTQGNKINPQILLNNVPVSGLSGAESSLQAFYIEVPYNANELNVTTTGGWGDSDMYLIYSKPPFYLYESYNDDNEENISVPNAAPGTWYIILEGWESYGGVTLNYSVTTSPSMVILNPTGKNSFIYVPVEFPAYDINPLNAKPIGVGSVANGGNYLDINIGLYRFAGQVDIYGAFIVSAKPQTVSVLNPSGSSFSSFTIGEILNALSTGVLPAGAQPWKASTTGPIDVSLFGTIPISTLPSGTYTAYILVTPAGSLSSYYLWMTTFVIP
jgi:hypothetical protein